MRRRSSGVDVLHALLCFLKHSLKPQKLIVSLCSESKYGPFGWIRNASKRYRSSIWTAMMGENAAVNQQHRLPLGRAFTRCSRRALA